MCKGCYGVSVKEIEFLVTFTEIRKLKYKSDSSQIHLVTFTQIRNVKYTFDSSQINLKTFN
jgi:hypothetical protein